MLPHYIDVPVDAPHTLAFRVPSARLAELRDALRVAYEHGDGTPLRELWRREIGPYRATRARMRWRVPAATIGDLARDMVRLADVVLASAELHTEVRALVERTRSACEPSTSLGSGDPPVDLAPGLWLFFASHVGYRLRRYLEDTDRQPFQHEWLQWAEDLPRLQGPTRVDPDADAHGERAGEPAQPGELEITRGLRFHVEEYDYETHERRPGREITPAEITTTKTPLIAVGPDGEVHPLPNLLEAATSAMRIGSQLELLVGPLVRSRGPGPFASTPPAAEAMISEDWDVLPLHRASPAWMLPRPRVVQPEALARVLAAVETAEPDATWWGELVDEDDVGRAHDRWITFELAVRSWWPRCRSRYLALLREARDAGDAVLFTTWAPDDQGTIHAPYDESHGEPVVV